MTSFLTGQYAAIDAEALYDGHAAVEDECSTLTRLAQLAGRLLEAPTALVSLVEPSRQRFAASVGLPEPWATAGETPLSHSFCQYVVATAEPLVISDARLDARLYNNLAIRDLGVISYLGVPIRARDGSLIGSFCVADGVPRVWTPVQRRTLEDLAEAVMSELDNEQAYAALADATASYRELLDTTTELVCAADADGLVTYVNHAWTEAFGYSKQEALGMRAVDLVAVEHRARFVDVARRLHAGERVNAFEVVAVGANGRRVVCRGNARSLLSGPNDARVCVGTRAVYHDVTRERHAEASRARLAATLEATSDFVGIAGGDGQIEYINTAGRRLLGLGEEIALQTLGADSFHPPATLALLAEEGFPAALRDGVWRGDGHLLHVNGSEIPVSIAMTAHPSLSPEEPGFFAAIMRDRRGDVAAAAVLKASEARFRAMFENAAVGVTVVGHDGTLLQVNRAFERMLGYEAGSLHGRHAPDLSPDEERERSRTPVAALRAGDHDSVTVEKRFYTASGDVRVLALTISRLATDDDSETILGLATDITDRLQAEANLTSERAFLSATLESLTDAVVACNANGQLMLFNKAAREMHGVPEQPIGPERWTETYSLYRADGVSPLPIEEIPLYRALQGEEVRDAEMVIAAVGTAARVLLASGRPLRNADGTAAGAVIAMHDVTERRRSEAALRDSEERFRLLVDLMPDGIITQVNGRVHFANAAMARLVGADDPAALIGLQLVDLLHPDERLDAEERLRGAQTSDAPIPPSDHRMLHRDGHVVECEVSRTHVQMQGERGVLAVVRDSTERRRNERALQERETQLATIYNHSSDVMLLMRVQRDALQRVSGYVCESVNEPLLAVKGATAAAYVGRTLPEIVEDARYASLQARFDDAVRTGQKQQFEWVGSGVNGPMTFETTLTPIRDASGRCTQVLSANRDVTARRNAEAALRESEASFRTMLQTVRAVAVTLDAKARVTFANESLLSLTGWSLDDVRGADWFRRFSPHPEVMRRLFDGMIDGGDFIPHYENELLTRGGRRRLIVWDNTVLRDSDGTIIGTASIGQDVTEQRLMEARLAALSETDDLTGLRNRRGFMSRMEEAMRHARRAKRMDALLYVDMDRFKPINDTYGHAEGDRALRAVTEVLLGTVRDTDIVGRLGGDEFAVYAAGLETPEHAAALADRLQEAVTAHNAAAAQAGRPYGIGFSVGIAWVQPDDSGDTLLARADGALYEVKHRR